MSNLVSKIFISGTKPSRSGNGLAMFCALVCIITCIGSMKTQADRRKANDEFYEMALDLRNEVANQRSSERLINDEPANTSLPASHHKEKGY